MAFVYPLAHLTALALHLLLVIRCFPRRKEDTIFHAYWWNMLFCVSFHGGQLVRYLGQWLNHELITRIGSHIFHGSLVILATTLPILFMSRYERPSHLSGHFSKLMGWLAKRLNLLVGFGFSCALASIFLLLCHYHQPLPPWLYDLSMRTAFYLVQLFGLIWLLMILSGLKPIESQFTFSNRYYRLVLLGALLLYAVTDILRHTPLGAPLSFIERLSSVAFALAFAWDKLRFTFMDVILRQGLRLLLTCLALVIGTLVADASGQVVAGMLTFVAAFFAGDRLARWLSDRVWFGTTLDRENFIPNLAEKLAVATTRTEAHTALETYIQDVFDANAAVNRPMPDQVATVTPTPALTIGLGHMRKMYPWYSQGLQLVHTAGLLLQSHLSLIEAKDREEAQRNKAREQEMLARNAELAALRARIRPHFLFNTLNAIHALIEEDPESAETTIERLADLMRGVLDVRDHHPLSRELHLAETYLSIEKVRFGKRLSYYIEVEEAAKALPVPAFSLQPLVENAVKHGTEHCLEQGCIHVGGRLEGGYLHLWVQDNGPGPGNSAQAGLGMALNNIRERLKALYADDAELYLKEAPGGGAMAGMILPLQMNQEANP